MTSDQLQMNHAVKLLDPEESQALTKCFGVFKFLRPHLDEVSFIERVRTQTREGYKIAYIEQENEIVAAAGYRVATFLAWGRVLYIDDLVTRPEKKRLGLAGALLDWLLEQGRQLGCDEVHLDTGFQRHDAHRLYLNKGFVLTCHHMSAKLK